MIKDESKVKQFLKVLEELSTTHIEIGILNDGKKYENKKGKQSMTVLGVAIINEFGLNIVDKNGRKINIPERSFIRNSYDNNKEKIFELESELDRVIRLELPVDTFFNDLGNHCVGIIQKYMTDEVKSPPNNPTTIKMKGSSNPLIDTGKLRDSVDFKIVRG